MSRDVLQRCDDVESAGAAIASHLTRGTLDDGLIFDAVRVRLSEIGAAVKSMDPDALEQEPGIAWKDVAGMRDHLAHRYFDTDHAIIQATIDHDLPPLLAAVARIRASVADGIS